MKMILIFVSFFLTAPLLFSADKPVVNLNSQDADITNVQHMIRSGVLIKQDGIEKIQTSSAKLSKEARELLYQKNFKNQSLVYFNLLIPSLGSLLVGDSSRAILSLGCLPIGAGSMLIGYYLFNSSFNGIGGASNQRLNFIFPVAGGFLMGFGGLTILLGSYVLPIIFSSIFSRSFNESLQAGLGLVSLSFYNTNPAYENMKAQFAYGSAPRANNLAYFELANVRF